MSHGKIYRIRRKGQQILAHILSKERISKIYYRINVHKKLHLDNPIAFTEKLQWLKLYYCPNNPKIIQCTDKFAVRDYIKKIGEEELLNTILGSWTNVEDIPWEELPQQFVLKCNHGCGYNIICKDKSKFNVEEAKRKLQRWMKENYASYDIEPHYGKIKRRIICEKYLGDEVANYNIYCFNGKPIFLSLMRGLADGKDEKLTYYYVDGTKAEFKNRAFQTDDAQLSPLLPEMVKCAERLSRDFPMVRVDLFDINGKIVLSELTFTPGGALLPIEPYEADVKLGKLLDISMEMKARCKNNS